MRFVSILRKLQQRFSLIRKKLLYKYLLIFLIPVLFIFLSTLAIYTYYLNFFEEELKVNYRNALNNVSQSINGTCYKIYQTNNMLVLNNSYLMNAMNFTGPYDEKGGEFTVTTNALRALSSVSSTQDFIDSVLVINRNYPFVITNKGTHENGNFFSSYHRYELYPQEFWYSYEPAFTGFNILDPSRVYTGNKLIPVKKVIPIVQTKFGSFLSSSVMVVNLDEEKLRKELLKYRLSPNSSLFILNKDGKILATTEENGSLPLGVDEQDFLPSLLSSPARSTERQYTFHGEKMLLVMKKTEILFNGFTYCALIPYRDIYSKSSALKTIGFAAAFLALLFSVLFSFFMSRRLYSPISKIVNLLKAQPDKSAEAGLPVNELDFISSGLLQMADDVHHLKSDINSLLPDACNQYLFKILNHSIFIDEQKVKEELGKYGLSFRYENFAAAVIRFDFEKEFGDTFQSSEQFAIFSRLAGVIQAAFPVEDVVHVLPVDRNKYCVIAALPDSESVSRIRSGVEKLLQLFEVDEALVKTHAGISQLHSGYIGLHTCYSEALMALSQLSPLSQERIRLFNGDQLDGNPEYSYTLSDDNKLYNYLIGGFGERAAALVAEIVGRNPSGSISERSLKELCMRIYFTVHRVLKSRNLAEEELLGERYMNIMDGFYSLTSSQMLDYVRALIEKLGKDSASDRNYSAEYIKKHIENHYMEDIYLDKLADALNTSPSYLSRVIKKDLGLSFQEYVSYVRIEKAKELLRETRKPVNEVFSLVGYNNRNSFISMFKKLEGITPSEYRELYKKEGGTPPPPSGA